MQQTGALGISPNISKITVPPAKAPKKSKSTKKQTAKKIPAETNKKLQKYFKDAKYVWKDKDGYIITSPEAKQKLLEQQTAEVLEDAMEEGRLEEQESVTSVQRLSTKIKKVRPKDQPRDPPYVYVPKDLENPTLHPFDRACDNPDPNNLQLLEVTGERVIYQRIGHFRNQPHFIGFKVIKLGRVGKLRDPPSAWMNWVNEKDK